mgnify:CR=1 FL=1
MPDQLEQTQILLRDSRRNVIFIDRDTLDYLLRLVKAQDAVIDAFMQDPPPQRVAEPYTAWQRIVEEQWTSAD